MNQPNINKILQEIARNNGVSVEEVRREIEFAAKEVVVPGAAEQPTAEEIISHLARSVAEKLK